MVKPTRDELRTELTNAYPGTTVITRDRGMVIWCHRDHGKAIASLVQRHGLDVTENLNDEPTYTRIVVFGFPRRKKN